MWKSKKFIVLPIVGIVLLVGGTTGVVMAQGGNGDQAQARQQAMLDRVAAIYYENTGLTLDTEQLKTALKQARSEMKDQALADRLQKLVADGKITDQQAADLLTWWQDRPDVGVQGLLGRGLGLVMMGGKGLDGSKLEGLLQKLVADEKITQGQATELLTWWNSRPEVTLSGPAEGKGFGGGMMRGRGMRGGMMGGRGFGGGMKGCPSTPDASGGTGATGA